MRKTILFAATWLVFFHCSNNSSTGPSAVASETWKLTDVGTNQNWATLTLSKLSNGGTSGQGSFIYTFYGYTITCSSMSGAATIADSSVSITMSGTAAYPPDSSGYVESSAFQLTMIGIFKNGACRGTWNISFTKASWQGWINPGTFTGARQNGSGVTPGS
jgi:hypothetical protein